MSMGSGIYRIVHIESNKTYIGSSRNIARRLIGHRCALNTGKHKNQILQATWNKYGVQAFVFEKLIECERGELIKREQMFMDSYRDHGIKLFNLRPASESNSGMTVSDETRAKLRLVRKDQITSDETREKQRSAALRYVAMKGGVAVILTDEAREKMWNWVRKPVTDETRKKLSVAGLNRPISAETREKMRISSLGREMSEVTREKLRVARRSQVFTEETREKLRIAGRNRVMTEATREKMRVINNNHGPISEETREKMRVAAKRRKATDETREKMRQSQLVRWQSKRIAA